MDRLLELLNTDARTDARDLAVMLGTTEEDVRRSAKSLYGGNLTGLNSADVIANAVMSMEFSGREMFRYIECFTEITADDVNARIQTLFDEEKAAVSIIWPLEDNA